VRCHNWGGGGILIYSCSARLTSFESDCFYGMWTWIYEFISSLPQFLLFSAGWFQANTPSGLLFKSRGRNLNISGERGAEIIALTMRLIWQYLQAVDMFISTSWTGWYVHINLINKLMKLINTYGHLKRISPLVWIDAGRPLDEKEISARNSARHYRSPVVREHAGKPS
jgi:hypothetical protein